MAVFAGVIAFHDSVVQWGTKPTGGFASRAPEMRFPEEENPLFMYAMKPRSRPPDVLSVAHVEPLLAEVTRCPPEYGLLLGEQLQA